MEEVAWSAVSAISGVSVQAAAVAIVAVAGASIALSGINAKVSAPLLKEEPSAELDALRKNRSASTQAIPNSTFLQCFMGGMQATVFVLAYIVAPVWICLCAYLTVAYPTELWAWAVMSPVFVSAILPPVPSKRMIRFLFPMCLAYFDYESVFEQTPEEMEKLKNSRSVLYAMQPHGVLSWGGLCGALHWNFFDPQTAPTAVANVIMRTPLLKHLIGLFGTVDASKKTLQARLKKKNGHVCLYIGGIAELFLSSPTEERLYLKKRKGFIKLALRTGAEVVPIYYFGNSHALKISRHKLVVKFARMTGVALTPMWGRWGTLVPVPVKVVSVIGKPLNMPITAVENPTDEMVNKYHALYESEIKRIFDTYKDLSPKYASKELVIE